MGAKACFALGSPRPPPKSVRGPPPLWDHRASALFWDHPSSRSMGVGASFGPRRVGALAFCTLGSLRLLMHGRRGLFWL